jgi:predicted metalloenzyme YecM
MMKEIIGDYEAFIEKADTLIAEQGIVADDLIQCDTICYRVETNERYVELTRQLAERALLISETEVNGRLISVFATHEPLHAGRWQSISYLEVPQPKPGSYYPEGIDHVQMVTRRELPAFHAQYAHLAFEEKGLASSLNPLLKLVGDEVSVKLHDKHMGAVVALEESVTR